MGVTKGKWLHYQTCIAVDAYIQRAQSCTSRRYLFETCQSIYCRLAGSFEKDKPPGHGSGVMSVFILLLLVLIKEQRALGRSFDSRSYEYSVFMPS